MSYAQALSGFRGVLVMAGMSPREAAPYTLHSLKTCLLAALAQLQVSFRKRGLQGHHRSAGNGCVLLYGRDDVHGALSLQHLVCDKIRNGWLPMRPQARGGQLPAAQHPIDPKVLSYKSPPAHQRFPVEALSMTEWGSVHILTLSRLWSSSVLEQKCVPEWVLCTFSSCHVSEMCTGMGFCAHFQVVTSLGMFRAEAKMCTGAGFNTCNGSGFSNQTAEESLSQGEWDIDSSSSCSTTSSGPKKSGNRALDQIEDAEEHIWGSNDIGSGPCGG